MGILPPASMQPRVISPDYKPHQSVIPVGSNTQVKISPAAENYKPLESIIPLFPVPEYKWECEGSGAEETTPAAKDVDALIGMIAKRL